MPWQDLRTAREGGNGFDLRFGACAVAVSLGVGRLWPRNPLTGSARSVAFPRVSRLDCDAARSGLPGSLCGRQCDVRVLAAKRPGRHKNRAPALLPWKYFVTITRRRFCGFASFCSEIAPVEVFLRFAPGRSRAYSGPLRPATAPIESVTKWPERSRGSQVSPWCFFGAFRASARPLRREADSMIFPALEKRSFWGRYALPCAVDCAWTAVHALPPAWFEAAQDSTQKHPSRGLQNTLFPL